MQILKHLVRVCMYMYVCTYISRKLGTYPVLPSQILNGPAGLEDLINRSLSGGGGGWYVMRSASADPQTFSSCM